MRICSTDKFSEPGLSNMALSSLNPRLLSSFSSSRRSQRFCDSAKSVEVSQSREHCPLVRGGMQGLNTNPVLHRLMNTVQVEQPWRRSCPLALHTSLLPTKMITLRKHCRGADGADNHHACFHDSIDGHLPQKESMNTSMTCHAQIHFEPSNMDDKALPSLQLSSLSERGIAPLVANPVTHFSPTVLIECYFLKCNSSVCQFKFLILRHIIFTTCSFVTTVRD